MDLMTKMQLALVGVLVLLMFYYAATRQDKVLELFNRAKYLFSHEKILRLKPINVHYQGSKGFDLHSYYIDENNKLYSRNPKTWEINPRKGHDILLCSDKSFNQNGDMHNTMRTTRTGRKVTVTRKSIRFNMVRNPVEVFVVKQATDRKFTIVAAL